jgi:DNA replication protein DnaC
VLDQVKNAPTLICDEFDVADVTTNKRSIVEKLIRYRHGQQLPTVLTTNLDADAFERRWERVIASVVRDRAHWIPMRGVSLRREAEQFEWE